MGVLAALVAVVVTVQVLLLLLAGSPAEDDARLRRLREYEAFAAPPSRPEKLRPLPAEARGARADNEFLPEYAPSRVAASVSIHETLAACEEEAAENDDVRPESLDAVLRGRALEARCSARVSFDELMCKLQCDADEPELEESFRAMGASRYSLDFMRDICDRGVVTALVWIYRGTPRFKVCGGRDHVPSHKLFESTRAVLAALACISNIPDVLFAVDTRDWAVPERAPHIPGWLQPLPGVARYTASPGHPTVLLPTNAYIRATTHCNVDQTHDMGAALEVCKQIDGNPNYRDRSWNDRVRFIFWRGSSTGVPLEPDVYAYLPRPALIRKFYDESGFDIGFINSKPPNSVPGYDDFFASHVRPSIRSHQYALYKFVLHCDGHTASWGLAQKLTTRSVIIWIESLFKYREFYYAHLNPWEHYIPADADLSNLGAIRDWIFSPAGDEFAEQVSERATRLFQTRLRPEATYCYLARLLASMSLSQAQRPTPKALRAANLDPSTFEDFPEFAGRLADAVPPVV